MFKFFEGLVDPYAPYTQSDTPPRQLWPFLLEYLMPFRKVFAATALLSMANAGAEVSLLWYMGHLVDILGQGTPEIVWAAHGTEILLVAAAIILIRPRGRGWARGN